MDILTGASSKTVRLMFRIETKAISHLRFIFEAYDNLAVVETLDPKAGLIALHVAPGCEGTAESILKDIGRNHRIEMVT